MNPSFLSNITLLSRTGTENVSCKTNEPTSLTPLITLWYSLEPFLLLPLPVLWYSLEIFLLLPLPV